MREWHALRSFSLPFNAGMSKTTTLAMTYAPSHLSIKFIAAQSVPPVASKSSINKTLESESKTPF